MAFAQSPIYGLDVRLQRFFTSTADANFVAGFTSIAPSGALPVFALDFDETATTLWGINNTTNEYGTFDLTTGAWTPLGLVSTTSGTPSVGASGLTCATDGTWYMSSIVATIPRLYSGDITTGSFAEVGAMGLANNLMIDISIDSTGQLFGYSISDDSLYSVDTTTGAATVIGVSGFATNFAQGMDFDWSTDTLYATLYTGGGTGQFATFNLLTGAATSLVATTPLNAEMEIAVKVAAPNVPGPVVYCTAGVSSNGCVPSISANVQPKLGNNAGCLITTTSIEGQKNGLHFYGIDNTGFTPTPWGTGSSFLCLKSPTARTPSANSGGVAGQCNGSLALNWDAFQIANPGSLGNPFSAGDSIYVQCWYRDPAASKATNLSDAVELTMQP